MYEKKELTNTKDLTPLIPRSYKKRGREIL